MAFALWQTLRHNVLGNIVGFGAGTAAAKAFDPALRGVGHELEQEFLSEILSPAELAAAVERGALDANAAAEEATKHGLDRGRFDTLRRLVSQAPAPEALGDMLNRRVIDGGRYRHGIQQGNIRLEWADALEAMRHRLIPPDALASLVAQGLLPAATGIDIAMRQGISEGDFSRLVTLHGSALAPHEALALWNRGIMDEGAVNSALAQNGMRVEWRERFKQLRQAIPTISDMIRFAVREVYSPDIVRRFRLAEDFPRDFEREVRKHGMTGQDALNYWLAHWDLPSPEQGFAMLHRGIINDAELKVLLRALDINPYWREKMIDLTYRIPGRIDIRRMFNFGVIDRARLIRGYLDLGYTPENAELLAQFAQAEKMDKERDLSKSEVLTLFEGDVLPKERAEAELERLGYDENERGWILGLAEAKKARAFRNTVVGVVKRRYLDREVDEIIARERLNTIGVSADEQDKLLDLWDFEKGANPRHITEAQMRTAWRRGLVTEGDYRIHLSILGYPSNEQEVLTALYAPEGERTERDLTEAQMRKAYKKEIVTAQQYRDHLARLGLDPAEIEILARVYEVA